MRSVRPIAGRSLSHEAAATLFNNAKRIVSIDVGFLPFIPRTLDTIMVVDSHLEVIGSISEGIPPPILCRFRLMRKGVVGPEICILIDSGAGDNYLGGTFEPELLEMFNFRKEKPMKVFVGDGRGVVVAESCYANLELVDERIPIGAGRDGTSKNCRFRWLPQVSGKNCIILGRRGMKQFGLAVTGDAIQPAAGLNSAVSGAEDMDSACVVSSERAVVSRGPSSETRTDCATGCVSMRSGCDVSCNGKHDVRAVGEAVDDRGESSPKVESPLDESGGDSAESYTVPLVSPFDDGVPVAKPVLSPEEMKQSERVVNRMINMGWRDVQRCPGLKIRCRTLTDSDMRDTQEQVHAFEVLVPPAPQKKNYRYAKKAWSKLGSEGKAEYRQQVNGYLDKKWWWPKPKDFNGPTCGPFQVFMVEPKRQRRRLVVDARPLNECLPGMSSDLPRTREVIQTLRCTSPPAVVCTDIREAFYRVRFHSTLLEIEIVDENGEVQTVLSDRLTFGAGFGPGVCAASLGELTVQVIEDCATEFLMSALFVDDAPYAGNPETMIPTLARVLYACGLCSFEVAIRKFKSICATPYVKTLMEKLSKYSLPDEISPKLDILGASASYRDVDNCPHLAVECARERLKESREEVLEWRRTGTFTMTSIFSVAGSYGYDACYLHASARAVSDCVRKLCGSRFHGYPWKKTIEYKKEFDEHDLLAFEYICDWFLREGTEEKINCVHLSPVVDPRLQDLDIWLWAAGDASLSGAGFVIWLLVKDHNYDGTGVPICDGLAPSSMPLDYKRIIIHEESWMWGAKDKNHHSNRKELRVVLKLLQVMSDLVERLTVAPDRPLKTFVRFGRRVKVSKSSDNNPSVCWVRNRVVNGEDAVRSSNNIERRPISRLLDAINCEERFLSDACDNQPLVHEPGRLNEYPDHLSRQFETVLHGMKFNEILNRSKDQWSSRGAERNSVEPTSETDAVNWLDDECEWDVEEERMLAKTEARVTVSSDDRDCLCIVEEREEGELVEDAFKLIRDRQLRARMNLRGDAKPPKEDPIQKSSADIAATTMYEYSEVHQGMKLLRLCFDAFKRNKSGEPKTVKGSLFGPPTGEDSENVVRSLQLSSQWCQDILTGRTILPEASPYVKSEDGVIRYRLSQPWGSWDFVPVVPESCPGFQQKIIKSAHCPGHFGLPRTYDHVIRSWYFVNLPKKVKDYIFHCVACQRLQAQKKFILPPKPGPDGVPTLEELQNRNAFYCSVIDVLVVGPKRKVLSIVCIFSKMVMLIPITSESEAATIDVLRIAKGREGPDTFAFILHDDATAWREKFKESCYRELGIRAAKFPPKAGWAAGPCGRVQYDILQRFRALLRNLAKKEDYKMKDDQKFLELIDQVCNLLNDRPLGEVDAQTGRAITPRMLGRGHYPGMYTDPEDESRQRILLPRVRLAYLNLIWREAKQRSTEACVKDAVVTERFLPGQACLVWRQAKGKNDVAVDVAHVVRQTSPSTVRVVCPSNRTDFVCTDQHHRNVCHLRYASMSKDILTIFPDFCGRHIRVEGNDCIIIQHMRSGRFRVIPKKHHSGVVKGSQVEQRGEKFYFV